MMVAYVMSSEPNVPVGRWSSTTSKKAAPLKIWKADSAEVIKQAEAESLLRCDVGTELEVLNALKRRGIAFQLSKLMSFEKHELIISLLFGELQREPLDGFKPSGLHWPNWLQQIVKFTSSWPKDEDIEAILELPAVMWLLMPQPKGAAADKHGPSNATPKSDPKKVPKPDDKKSPPKRNKFDKLKGKRGKTPMPVQLCGGHRSTMRVAPGLLFFTATTS